MTFHEDLENERALKLSREQRSQLLAGHYEPLKFDEKPCEPGARYILSWSKATQVDNGRGDKRTIPRAPLHWIEVTHVVPRKKGGFTVRYDVMDKRDPCRFVRRTPPQMTDEIMRADLRRHPNEDATTQASEQSNYSSNRISAVDDIESVPRKYTPPDATELHRKQRDHAKQISLRGQSIGAQVDSYLRDARDKGIDTHGRERRFRQELEKLKRDVLGEEAA